MKIELLSDRKSSGEVAGNQLTTTQHCVLAGAKMSPTTAAAAAFTGATDVAGSCDREPLRSQAGNKSQAELRAHKRRQVEAASR